MRVKVKFLAHFKELFGGEVKEVEGAKITDIRNLLELLCNSPERREAIFDCTGALSPEVLVMSNGRHIQFLNGVQTALGDEDVVVLAPRVYGG
jgi:molybdopterin synthase sulfur carrier subunit